MEVKSAITSGVMYECGSPISYTSCSVTDATDNDYQVTAGTYSVTETVPAGWDKTGDTCQNVVVADGNLLAGNLRLNVPGKIYVIPEFAAGISATDRCAFAWMTDKTIAPHWRLRPGAPLLTGCIPSPPTPIAKTSAACWGKCCSAAKKE